MPASPEVSGIGDKSVTENEFDLSEKD